MGKILHGKLVRLTAEEPKTLAELYSRASQDSEYWRLMTTFPTRTFSVKSIQQHLDENLEKRWEHDFPFSVRTLEDDHLIGDVGLDGVHWLHGEAFVGIAITERDYWGKGYGTDAMRVILRYAFLELNLQRVSLDVFEYNPRALRSYEKAGFKHEGCLRGALLREGRRWDMIFMGILRQEWLALPADER
jgi:RimJ/RimL family protein N-acetyltransferase